MVSEDYGRWCLDCGALSGPYDRLLRTVATLTAENVALRAALEDARETLRPFEAKSLPGYDAQTDRLVTITVREADLCQAWQVLTVGSRWRPAALSSSAAASSAEVSGDEHNHG